MDESHLIASTVHGNTADLPTALASIIGLVDLSGVSGLLGSHRCQRACGLMNGAGLFPGHPRTPASRRLLW